MSEKDKRHSGANQGSKKGENGQSIPDEASLDINTDENIAGTSLLNDEVRDDNELEKVQEELQAQKDKYLRLIAEFDNFRKRKEKESYELRQTAGREVIVSLLEVLDDCDRAEKQLQTSKENGQLAEGVQLVFNKLRTTLRSLGLQEMESLHTDFDPEKHEAITEIPAQDKSLKGKVLDELTKGYYLNGKIIRFAKVVVGK
jgi:molecular chaperone GrpE